MMLPLSTIEGKDASTEEVKTKPPEKGGERPTGGQRWAVGVGRVSRAQWWGRGDPADWSQLLPLAPPHLTMHPGTHCSGLLPAGGACGITMLPLSPIEGKDASTEEVRTKPPEKRGENPREPRNRGRRVLMAVRLSFLLSSLPFQPSVCFTFYLETDDSDSDSKASPEIPKPSKKCNSPPKAGAEYQEIQAWECPLCCLSIFCLS
uniref:Uncharacterized protein n=1 Tax=Catagonus wagneri TaxID=51154 RepID=A0A8C3WBL6_9CETA